MPPYGLHRADLSGTEDRMLVYQDLGEALNDRDHYRATSDGKRVHWRVLDEDDPERGDLDWEDAEVEA